MAEKYFYEKGIAALVGAMHRKLSDKLNRLLLGGKISISDIVVLEVLFHRKTSNMSKLSLELKRTMSAVTAMIDKMVKLKLVKRHHRESDRRVVEVSLTKKGNKLACRVEKDRLAIIKDVFSVLTEREKELYLKLIDKLYKGLKDKR